MTVSLKEIAFYMRMGRALPEGELADRVLRLRDEALGTIGPRRVWRRFQISGGAISSGYVRLDISGSLARHMAGCGSAFLVCGTIGPRFDAFQRRVSVGSGLDALIAQAIGAALVEKLMDETEADIRAGLSGEESLLPRYSPGYGDFPLSAQRQLFALLDAPRAVGVSLTDDLLMVPTKSVSAVIGVARE